MYYDPDIQPLPGSDPPPSEQPAPVSEAPATNQALPAPMEVPTASHQDAGQGERVEASQGKALDVASSQSEQVVDHQDPKTKA